MLQQWLIRWTTGEPATGSWAQDPRITDVFEEWRLACFVWSHRRATVKVHAVYNRTYCVGTHSLLRMGLFKPSEGPYWPLSTAENIYNGHVRIRIGPAMEEGGWSQWIFLHHVDSWVCIRYLPGEEMIPWCIMERRQASGRECDALGNALLCIIYTPIIMNHFLIYVSVAAADQLKKSIQQTAVQDPRKM